MYRNLIYHLKNFKGDIFKDVHIQPALDMMCLLCGCTCAKQDLVSFL